MERLWYLPTIGGVMKIDFEFTTSYGVFRDALHLPDDHTFTNEQITAMKQERVDNWLFAIENPPEPEPEMIEAEDG
jgi:hypothetical protein